MSIYWYNGALITSNKTGYDVILTPTRIVHRNTEQKAKWAATAFRTLHGITFQETLNAS